MPRVLGVDGCPGGWVVAEVTGLTVRWHLLADADAVLALADGAPVGLDMPVGLAEDAARACDVEARRWLGRAGSSVFPAPVRAVLDAPDHPSASAASRAARGVGLSIQSWYLVPKIVQWDCALTAPGVRADVAEVHPEIAFRLLAGRPDLPSKKTADGRRARCDALRPWLPDVDALVAEAPRPARPDDALDALVCAWSARRVATGEALVLGDPAARDARGLPMLIRA